MLFNMIYLKDLEENNIVKFFSSILFLRKVIKKY